MAGWFSDGVTEREGRFQHLSRPGSTTRTGAGPFMRLGPGASLELQVAGQEGVPGTGAMAVAMNVAVTNTTAQSYLTVHAAGEPRPLASNLNWAPARR